MSNEAPKTVPGLIDRFGGISAFARLIGAARASTASEMKRRASIPVKHWPKVVEAAGKAGFDLSAEDLVQMHVKDKH